MARFQDDEVFDYTSGDESPPITFGGEEDFDYGDADDYDADYVEDDVEQPDEYYDEEEEEGGGKKGKIIFAAVAGIGLLLVLANVVPSLMGGGDKEESEAPAIVSEAPATPTQEKKTSESATSSTTTSEESQNTDEKKNGLDPVSPEDGKEPGGEVTTGKQAQNVDPADLSLIGVTGQGDTDSGSGLIQAYDYAFYNLKDAEKASSYAVDNPLWSPEVLDATISKIPDNLDYKIDITRTSETEYDVILHLSRDGKSKSFKQKYIITSVDGQLKIKDKVDYGPVVS